MKNRALVAMGIPAGPCAEEAKRVIAEAHAAGSTVRAAGDALQPIIASPDAYLDDARYGVLASHLKAHQAAAKAFTPRASAAPYRIWGEHLEARFGAAAAERLQPAGGRGRRADARCARRLRPADRRRARDRNAVIPYAVGVDIACRMKLTVLDLPVERPGDAARTSHERARDVRRASASAAASR